MANKIAGKGTLLQCEFTTSVWTTISSRTEISQSGMTVETKDTTDLDSSEREFKPTIADFGEVSFDFWYDPDDSTHTNLFNLVGTPAVKNWKTIFTDDTPATFSYAGILTSFEVSGLVVDDYAQGSITVKITGAITKS